MTEDDDSNYITAKEFERITEVLIRKLPLFMDEITKAMANEIYVQRFGFSVCQFYRSLKQEGMEDREALELTKEYIHAFNIGAIVKGLEKIEDIRKLLGIFSVKRQA